MKKILFSISILIFSVSCLAQDSTSVHVDSSTVKLDVTLKAEHHAFIISFLPKGTVPVINYINQVRSGLDSIFKEDTLITVTIDAALVVEVYSVMGEQKERLTAVYNEEIKNALLQQIGGHTWLIRQLTAIAVKNHTETAERVGIGAQFIMSIVPPNQ